MDLHRDLGIGAEDPLVDAYAKGVDRTLLRETLALSWDERARDLMALIRAAEELRRAGERIRARRARAAQ
jgi:hypothetical protein